MVKLVRSSTVKSREITMFESVGVAVQDAAAASHILHSAEKLGLGTVVDL